MPLPSLSVGLRRPRLRPREWVWAPAYISLQLGYHVYANTGAGDPINYNLPVATVSGVTWTSGALAYPGDWKFAVRAFDLASGLEEQNLDCAVEIILDSSGNDITSRPLPPFALRALATTGASVRVEWAYGIVAAGKTPTGFHVYIGTGGSPNYSSAVATVSFSSAIANAFVANLTGLSDGTAYTVGVRAYNATAEEPNTQTVSVTADATGPSSVTSLTATAIT